MRTSHLLLLVALLTALPFSSYAQWIGCRGDLPSWDFGLALDALDSMTAVVSVNWDVGKTTDGGVHWTILPHLPAPEAAVDLSMTSGGTIFAATDEGRVVRWTEGDTAWTEQFANVNLTEYMDYIHMFDAQRGVAMGDPKNPLDYTVFLQTTDGGGNWEFVNSTLLGVWSGDDWRRLDFASMDVGYFFESGSNPQLLLKTTDGGASWFSTQFPDTLYAMRVKFYNDSIGLVYGSWWVDTTASGLVAARTIDGACTWEVFPLPTMGWGNDIEFIPGNPARVWMTDNKDLYASLDTGRTWTKFAGLGGRDIKFTGPDHGWLLGGDGQLLRTSNGGGVMAVNGRDQLSASGFALLQNYPNPFNPTTTIHYTVGGTRDQGLGASEVRIVIYDVLGREVATLVNTRQAPGAYEVKFNGSQLASGIYFYRLSAGGFTSVRTMTLVK